MRNPILGALRVSCLAALLAVIGSAAAAFEVEEWDAQWDVFSDDFADGVFPDGDPGKASLYSSICGGVSGDGLDDADETGGALVISGPDADPGCGGGGDFFGVGNFFGPGLASTGAVRATFRWVLPRLGESYGLGFAGFDTDSNVDDLLQLSLVRTDGFSFPYGPDVLAVVLMDETVSVPLSWELLSTDPGSYPAPAAIELELDLSPGASGLAGAGSYRLCQSSPCEDESTTPLQPLVPFPFSPPSAAAELRAGEMHQIQLAGVSEGAQSFAFPVEEWSVVQQASDDFEDGVLGADVAYLDVCGRLNDSDEHDGALTIGDPACPEAESLAFYGGQLGEITSDARYRFAVPSPCSFYGLSVGQNEALVGSADFATLGVVRSVPANAPATGEALLVLLSTESASGDEFPVVAGAIVSTDPDDDLADVEFIDLRLSVVRDGGGGALLPDGEYRLCTDSSCLNVPFTPLDPNTAAPIPALEICGRPASTYDPPADAGALSDESLGTALVAFVTEPSPTPTPTPTPTSGPIPDGTYPPIHIDDDPLFGGHFEINEPVFGARLKGAFILKGNGDIEGDVKLKSPGCKLRRSPVSASVEEQKGVIRLKMKMPITGHCPEGSVSGKAKIMGEINSNGDFDGMITVKDCAEGRCEKILEAPLSFDLGDQQGGPWDFVIKNVAKVKGKTPSGKKKLSGKCTLKLDGSAKGDWLKFDLSGTYDKATGMSTINCKGNNSFSQGARIKIKDLVVGDGEIISGRIGGSAFGQKIHTRVP